MVKKKLSIAKKYTLYSLILLIAVLVGYEFEELKSIIKNIIVGLINKDIAERLNYLYIVYLRDVIKIIVYVELLMIFIISSLIKYLEKTYASKNLKHFENDNDLFNKALNKYVKGDTKSAFLVSGDWGVGKTYKVRNFIDQYISYMGQKVYYISCFGIESKNDLITQLKELYGKQDDSLKLKISEIIRGIPIIGEFLYEVLKPKYEFKDMNKKSIFIFDDFERVTSIPNEYNNYNSNRYYKVRNYSPYHNYTRNEEHKEINYIKEELEKIEKSFANLEGLEERIITTDILNKYNIVTGIINELVDIYEMKVIVICNSELIDKNYYREIFEGKLECIKFKINDGDVNVENLAIENIERYVSLKDEKKNYLLQFFKEHNKDIKNAWINTNLNNTRILSGIILAFINFIDEIDLDIINEKDTSIFYSIFIAHINYNYHYDIELLKLIRTGESLICYDKKIRFSKINIIESRKFDYLYSIKDKENITWCGVSIAFSWLIGNRLSKNVIIKEINEMDNYNNSIEKYLAADEFKREPFIDVIKKSNKVNIDDLLIGIGLDDNKDYEYSNIIKDIFETVNINFEETSSFGNVRDLKGDSLKDNIIVLMEYVDMLAMFRLNIDLKNLIFEKMYSIFKNSNSFERSSLDKNGIKKLYNDWIIKKELEVEVINLLKEIFNVANIKFETRLYLELIDKNKNNIEESIFILIDKLELLEMLETNIALQNIIFEKLYITIGDNINNKKNSIYHNKSKALYDKWVEKENFRLNEIAFSEVF